MVTMPDYAEHTQMYDNVSGLLGVREAIERVRTPAYLEQINEAQRHLTRFAVGLDATQDVALARDQYRAVADLAKHTGVKLAIPETVAAAFTVAGSQHLPEVANRSSVVGLTDSLSRATGVLAADNARQWPAAFHVADLQKFDASAAARFALPDETSRILTQAFQSNIKLAMSDVGSSLQAALANVPTGIEPMLASMRDIAAEYRPNLDPFAAYGPFVHIRPESPRWNPRRDWGRDDSWDEPAETDDTFERTDSGIYVRRRGRPPGITDYTEAQFMDAIADYCRSRGKFPTMQAIADHMYKSLKTVKRYCKRWGIDWYDLRFTLRVD